MNRPVLIFLLGLSLIFNVFFIIGAMTWRTSAAESEAGIIKDVVDRLELDTRQADAFQYLRQADQDETGLIREQLAMNNDIMMEILASEMPDINRLRTLARQDIELRSELHKVRMENHLGLVELLTPRQRQRLAEQITHGRPPHRGPREPRKFSEDVINRFDLDGNGQLDKAERREAREFAKQQHRDRRERARKLQQRFDLDKDGRLDHEEENAMRMYLLENGMEYVAPPPPGRRDGHPPHHPPRHPPHHADH